jgi:putative membrane protein
MPEAIVAAQADHSARLPASGLNDLVAGRLHPLTLVLGVIKVVQRGIIPAVPLIFIGRRGFGWAILGLLALMSVSTLLIRYFTFRYRVVDGELRTEEGIFQRTQRHIPLERVQEIRLEQSVLQRLFGVFEVVVETGGGKEPEASLSVLSQPQAEQLRTAVYTRLAKSKTAPASVASQADTQTSAGSETAKGIANAEESVILRRLSWRDLLLAGITSNHLVSGMVVAGALWSFLDDVLPQSVYRRIGRWLTPYIEQLFILDAWTTIALAMGALLAALLAGTLFSVIGTSVLFFDFTLTRRGEDLHRRYGLLTRRASNLPRRRIQVLKIEEGLLRRLCGLATLRADVSGVRSEGSDERRGRDVLLPVIHRREIPALLSQIFPALAMVAQWKRVSRQAVRRGTLKSSLLLLLLTTGLLWLRHFFSFSVWYLVVPLLLLPLVYWLNLIAWQYAGYAADDEFFQTCEGWLSRATHIVPVSRMQVIEIRQSPFDRRLGLASLRVDTAGQAYTEGGPHISNLPEAEARTLAWRLAHLASSEN